jgi:hypothetical protein
VVAEFDAIEQALITVLETISASRFRLVPQ